MSAKFKIGDRVRLTGHETKIITGKTKKPKHSYKKGGIVYTPNPEGLKLIDRNRPRTIVKIVRNKSRKRNLYYLGSYGQLANIPFDSTQLTTEPSPKPGRPREKRSYHWKQKRRHIKHRNRS